MASLRNILPLEVRQQILIETLLSSEGCRTIAEDMTASRATTAWACATLPRRTTFRDFDSKDTKAHTELERTAHALLSIDRQMCSEMQYVLEHVRAIKIEEHAAAKRVSADIFEQQQNRRYAAVNDNTVDVVIYQTPEEIVVLEDAQAAEWDLMADVTDMTAMVTMLGGMLENAKLQYDHAQWTERLLDGPVFFRRPTLPPVLNSWWMKQIAGAASSVAPKDSDSR